MAPGGAGVVAFLLFGAKRLPELGKGLGEGLKGFKEGIKGVTDPTPAPPVVQQQNVAPAPPVSAPVEPRLYARTDDEAPGGSNRLPSTILELRPLLAEKQKGLCRCTGLFCVRGRLAGMFF